MAARRETADPAPSQTPVGADSISARFAAGQGPAGGINPSPTNRGERPAKREGHAPPGGRRAGCPHPAAPRGGARFRFLKFPRCGGRKRPPYGPGPTWRPAGKPRGPWRHLNQGTPCEGPAARAFHHPAPPRSAGARGKALPAAGGPWPSPTNHGERPAKREGHTPPGGRRAGCPHRRHPRGADPARRGGASTRGRDKWPSPTNHGEHPAKWRRPRPLLSQRPGACLFMVLL